MPKLSRKSRQAPKTLFQYVTTVATVTDLPTAGANFKGAVVYVIDTDLLKICNGTAWKTVTPT